ncbi:sec-independent translocation protein mttA/Hcf106 [Pirellula staleyi DSM 6068]|uniref:Sec-independent translocation protein mttA/Hcf106 n=1 Tax=Pirellula staleyi (strain ATCC 27377 / DSM 6068 / ICPB 4128) TaxID=530564 RepID=D2R7C0_PIRSD|nr:twin-arginine translocase TatA/TatE family subunit [Pirellula staleyi]ADB15616.1 sec-independent translocation protein mttA/Hcf106 [Pirellula staleyi DSM 6068]
MFGLGPSELIIFGIIAIMLFGKNLPEVAKKFGKSYREFRKGLSDIQGQVDFTETYNSTPVRSKPAKRNYDNEERDEVSAPKFEPPTAPPSYEESQS